MPRNVGKIKDNKKKELDYSELSVIIPAAGMGRRMKSYGPKGLISLNNGSSVLERQIRILNKLYPGAEITIICGFEADAVREGVRKKFPVKIIRNENYQDTNVARSLFLGLESTTKKHCLVVYGDLVFNTPTLKNLVGGNSKIVVDSRGNISQDEVGILVSEGAVTNFSYALPEKWCHIAYMAEKEMRLFEDISSDPEKSRWFGYEIMNKILDQGGSFESVEPSGMKIAEIDTPKDLRRALEVALSTR